MNGTAQREFENLPVDDERGFPQELSHVLGGRTYRFRLYVNVPAERLTDGVEFLELPTPEAHLVVRVEREVGGGGREPLFLRKVVPGVVYEAERIAFEFPEQRVARANLNGRGRAGSRVTGRIAERWA